MKGEKLKWDVFEYTWMYISAHTVIYAYVFVHYVHGWIYNFINSHPSNLSMVSSGLKIILILLSIYFTHSNVIKNSNSCVLSLEISITVLMCISFYQYSINVNLLLTY
jgi:hypothetical protein